MIAPHPNGINGRNRKRIWGSVAEEVGFEPTEDLHLRWFSRPVHSTTLPLLRQGQRANSALLILKLEISSRTRLILAGSRRG